jgi:hypothetical protein
MKHELHEFMMHDLVRYLQNPYNWVDISRCVLMLGSLLMMGTESAENIHALQAGAGLASGAKVLFFLRGLDAFAFLIGMLEQVMRDMSNFMVVLFIILATFSYTFFMLLHDSKLGQQDDYKFSGIMSFVASFDMMFGSFSIIDFQQAPFAVLAVVLFIVFMMVVSIVMLNALIAIMSDTFERVQQHKTAAAVLERAKVIIELEQRLASAAPTSDPPSAWKIVSATLLSLGIGYRSHSYLHVLQPDFTGDDDEWEGRMRMLMRKFDAMKANQEELREQQKQAEERMEKKMGEKLDALLKAVQA